MPIVVVVLQKHIFWKFSVHTWNKYINYIQLKIIFKYYLKEHQDTRWLNLKISWEWKELFLARLQWNKLHFTSLGVHSYRFICTFWDQSAKCCAYNSVNSKWTWNRSGLEDRSTLRSNRHKVVPWLVRESTIIRSHIFDLARTLRWAKCQRNIIHKQYLDNN